MPSFRLFFALAACSAMGACVQAPTIPVPTCVMPTLAGRTAPFTQAQADKLNAENRAYRDCVSAYHEARKAVVDEHNAIAVANANAAQKLDDEFNRYVEALDAALATPKKPSKAE